MSRFYRLFLVALLGLCMVPAAFSQLFSAKPAEDKSPQGIGRIPPPLPVMSADDFQSKVKSLSDQNFKSMTMQGYDTIQQQRNALPPTKTIDPPPLPPKSNSSPSGNQTASTPQAASPVTPPALTPPTPAEAPEPASVSSGGSSSSTGSSNADSGDTSQGYTGFSGGDSNSSASSPSSSGSSGGQLDIKY